MVQFIYSVTQWIKSEYCKQPQGGFIPIKLLKKIVFPEEEGQALFPQSEENISANIVGIVVDYLTRWIIESKKSLLPESVFRVPFTGLKQAWKQYEFLESNGKKELAQVYFNFASEGKAHLDNLFKKLRTNAIDLNELIPLVCFITPLDTFFRSGYIFPFSRIKYPNVKTIQNISIMISRIISYFSSYKKSKEIYAGVFFNPSAFSNTRFVKAGDGDFMTENSLVELKTSRYEKTIDSNATLQGFLYYLLGRESGDSRFSSLRELCFYNPRLNIEWSLDLSLISENTIREIKSQW